MFRMSEFFDCFTIFLSLCTSEVDVNTTMVTASIPVVIQDGQRKKGIRAVAGPQMKYENLKIYSWTVSQIVKIILVYKL